VISFVCDFALQRLARSREHTRRGPALTIAAVASYPYDG
jgi:hypothetical protein